MTDALIDGERRAQVVRDRRRGSPCAARSPAASQRPASDASAASSSSASDDAISRANASRIAVLGVRLDGAARDGEHVDRRRARPSASSTGSPARARRPRGSSVQPASVAVEDGDGVERENRAAGRRARQRVTGADAPPGRRAPRPPRAPGRRRRRDGRRATTKRAHDAGDHEEDDEREQVLALARS